MVVTPSYETRACVLYTWLIGEFTPLTSAVKASNALPSVAARRTFLYLKLNCSADSTISDIEQIRSIRMNTPKVESSFKSSYDSNIYIA